MAQLAARRSHNPKVAGSIPVESTLLPVSLGGQDTRLSPERPGFNSRTGNFFSPSKPSYDRALSFFFVKIFKKEISFFFVSKNYFKNKMKLFFETNFHHTVIPPWIYQIPSELWSQAGLGLPSTVVGDHTGIVGAVCFFLNTF